MNKEIKERWIKALRSGRYRQTTGALRRPTGTVYEPGYCCLGVLCRVVAPNAKWTRLGTAYEFLGESALPPDLILKKAEIDEDSDAFWQLPTLNDYGQKSFKEIADYIEENL